MQMRSTEGRPAEDVPGVPGSSGSSLFSRGKRAPRAFSGLDHGVAKLSEAFLPEGVGVFRKVAPAGRGFHWVAVVGDITDRMHRAFVCVVRVREEVARIPE